MALPIPDAWKPFAKPPEPAKVIPMRRQHVDDCVYCSHYQPGEMFPPHDASLRCESGKRNHCTCDTCF